MICKNGPILTYSLVYRFFPRPIKTLKSDGYYHSNGYSRGILVQSISGGVAMYHRPEEMLDWKCKASHPELLSERLYNHIKHGDEEHKKWLKDELNKFFNVE